MKLIYPDIQNSARSCELKDRQGAVIGRLRARGGRTEVRDPQNNLRGWFDERSGNTFDSHHRLIGSGNLLALLLNPTDMLKADLARQRH